MGPFRLMDLTGIDLAYDIGMGKFQKTGNPADLPFPGVVRKVTEGKFGQKTGEGWYKYSK
jgi:3-hydroxybutyryl-CoA dehydrogenase